MKPTIFKIVLLGIFALLLRACAAGDEMQSRRTVASTSSQNLLNQKGNTDNRDIVSKFDDPSDGILNISVYPLTNTSVELSWNELSDENGEPMEYLVYYSSESMGDSVKSVQEKGLFEVHTIENSAVIDNLDETLDYYFVILTQTPDKRVKKTFRESKGSTRGRSGKNCDGDLQKTDKSCVQVLKGKP